MNGGRGRQLEGLEKIGQTSSRIIAAGLPASVRERTYRLRRGPGSAPEGASQGKLAEVLRPLPRLVQAAGDALELPASVLQDEFKRGSTFQIALLRDTQSLITRMPQTAVCNQLHSIDQRLCRCLLLSHDRTHADQIVLAQELIARRLGVRREKLAVATGRLQAADLIRQALGRIAILDRSGLEARVCECYGVERPDRTGLLGRRPAPSRSRFVR